MSLQNKRIAILLAEGVEDLEFYVPLMRLQEEGADVIAAALDQRKLRGKNGLEISPTATIESLQSRDLFALLIPGGWAPDKLRRHAVVTKLVRDVDEAKKPIGIICHGGLVAISAGIVRGHRVTGSLGIKDDLINAGATWVDTPALRDQNQVWGRIVADIPIFCRELMGLLIERSE